MKQVYTLLIVFLSFSELHSQTVINDYFQVTATTASTATVTSSTGINGTTPAIGDTIMIIQMQGATIDQTNTASFGTTTVNNAGNFELAVICDVGANSFSFKHNLVRSYTPATGAVQLVSHGNGKTIHYTVPAGGHTATAWNGSVGGVLFIKASGTITLNGNLNADGRGFRGGAPGGIVGLPGTVCNKNVLGPGCAWGVGSYTNDGCNGAMGCDEIQFFYPSNPHALTCGTDELGIPATLPKPANNNDFYKGGWKGEGIAAYIAGKETGRGPQANGGGGGQSHNSGGAGGGNYGMGGAGGNQFPGGSCSATIIANGGMGGKAIVPPTTKVYMGGGGGAGHGNYPNGHSTPGGNGGGAIIIVGSSLIVPAARTISANGNTVVGAMDGDSEGGGGAGGSIYLDVAAINNGGSNALTLTATGGAGGNASNNQECIGPGGGGGGGYIISKVTIPAPTTQTVTGGTAGSVSDGSLIPNWKSPHYGFCGTAAANFNFGATNGSNGLSSVNAAVSTQRGVTPITCVLPLTFISFEVKEINKDAHLYWSTTFDPILHYFEIEKSSDGKNYSYIGTIAGSETSQGKIENYRFTDYEVGYGNAYYRVKQVGTDGSSFYSISKNITIGIEDGILSVYPHPVKHDTEFIVEYFTSDEKEIQYKITDAFGKDICSASTSSVQGINQLSIPITNIISGLYFFSINTGQQMDLRKIIIE
jgi:hypothetical protein